MSDSPNIKPIFLTTISFMSGVAAGLLLAPKDGKNNRTWLSNRLKGISSWKQLSHRLNITGTKREIHQLRHHLNRGLQQNIPDAYKATEYIPLTEREMLHG